MNFIQKSWKPCTDPGVGRHKELQRALPEAQHTAGAGRASPLTLMAVSEEAHQWRRKKGSKGRVTAHGTQGKEAIKLEGKEAENENFSDGKGAERL